MSLLQPQLLLELQQAQHLMFGEEYGAKIAEFQVGYAEPSHFNQECKRLFGDPLFTLALTQMALLKRRYDTEYVTFWSDALGLTAEQRAVLTLYTAIFWVDFLGEMRQSFNHDSPTAVGDREIDHLVVVLEWLLAVV